MSANTGIRFTHICTQHDADDCGNQPEPLGTCVACGYIFHNIPMHTDEAHGQLCCGLATGCTGFACMTHWVAPADSGAHNQGDGY